MRRFFRDFLILDVDHIKSCADFVVLIGYASNNSSNNTKSYEQFIGSSAFIEIVIHIENVGIF